MSIVLGTPEIYHNKKFCSSNIEHIDHQKKVIVLNQVKNVFQNLGIRVITVDPHFGTTIPVCSLLWVRDMFVKIGSTYVLLPGVKKTDTGLRREKEYKSIIPLLKDQPTILHDIPGSSLEGGDILQHSRILFVGIGERTNEKGAEFLRNQFPEMTVVTIRHKALHLDCCFCVLNRSTVLYAKKYISYLPKAVTDKYHCYDIESMTGTKMTNLATNIVRIGKTIVAAYDSKFEGLYRFLRSRKYKIEFIDFYGLEKEGGGVRCLLQWLDPLETQKIM